MPAHYFYITLAAFAVFIAACAPPLPVPSLRIESEQSALRRQAAALLPAGDKTAPLLILHETVSEKIESVAGDGTANAYAVNYTLAFTWQQQTRKISLKQVVSVSESKYLAGRRARADAVDRLRRQALSQMRYALSLLPA